MLLVKPEKNSIQRGCGANFLYSCTTLRLDKAKRPPLTSVCVCLCVSVCVCMRGGVHVCVCMHMCACVHQGICGHELLEGQCLEGVRAHVLG